MRHFLSLAEKIMDMLKKPDFTQSLNFINTHKNGNGTMSEVAHRLQIGIQEKSMGPQKKPKNIKILLDRFLRKKKVIWLERDIPTIDRQCNEMPPKNPIKVGPIFNLRGYVLTIGSQ